MNDVSLEVSIRQAKPDDYVSLLSLFDQIDALHRENLPDKFKRPEGEPRKEDYYLDLLADEDVSFLIAEQGDQIIGFIHTVIRSSPPIEIFIKRRLAVIESVVVKKKCQGKGVGRKLVEAAHGWAVAQGAESVELNVYEFNKHAIAFYDQLGYETLSRTMRKRLSKQDTNDAG